jgi:hypothetical protein
MQTGTGNKYLSDFLNGKPALTVALFDHFIAEFQKIGPVSVLPGKTMIGIANGRRKIAYVSQFGRAFIHVVFLFKQPYYDNLCFQKIVPMPKSEDRFTHHLRILHTDDVNNEVRRFMQMAYDGSL